MDTLLGDSEEFTDSESGINQTENNTNTGVIVVLEEQVNLFLCEDVLLFPVHRRHHNKIGIVFIDDIVLHSILT